MTNLDHHVAICGYHYIDALHDIEAYLPPDYSDRWTNANELISARSETESAFNDAILALKLQTLSDYQDYLMVAGSEASYDWYIQSLKESS